MEIILKKNGDVPSTMDINFLKTLIKPYKFSFSVIKIHDEDIVEDSDQEFDEYQEKRQKVMKYLEGKDFESLKTLHLDVLKTYYEINDDIYRDLEDEDDEDNSKKMKRSLKLDTFLRKFIKQKTSN
uniref:Uncharacterized protein n=1 Tax=viral metagenome TaxID=1070528 RepID=A0A6C0AEG5_9ZZZZ